jgi:hypothetical protein
MNGVPVQEGRFKTIALHEAFKERLLVFAINLIMQWMPFFFGAQPNSRQVQAVVGWSFLSNDQQSHIRNGIEDQKDDLEQPEKGVNDHVEGFSRNGKPFALRTVHQIWGKYTHCAPKDQQGAVYDCTPHKECC